MSVKQLRQATNTVCLAATGPTTTTAVVKEASYSCLAGLLQLPIAPMIVVAKKAQV